MRKPRGYSFIELLVVLAIIGILAVIGIPWMVRMMRRQAFKSAAHEIQISLAAARMTAVKRNAPVSLAILSLTPPIQLQVVEPPPPNPTPTLPPSYVNLPANAIRFQTTPASHTVIGFGGDGRLLTTPALGTTPYASFFVEGPANSSPRNPIEIRITRGGAVSAITPVDWQ